MARERYLVGVSKEELEYKPPAPPPMTPKDKLQNIWYHYKWAILGGAFGLFVLIVLTVQAVTRDEADYYVCMGAMTYIPDAVVEQMEQALAAHGTDLNGDGQVLVTIQNLNVSLEDSTLTGTGTGMMQTGMVNRQAIFAHIAARDMNIYIFDPEYYASLETAMEDGARFFEPLGTEHAAISEDGTWFTWDLYAFAKQAFPDTDLSSWKGLLPEDMIVGVRAMRTEAGEEEQEITQAALTMLKGYLAQNTAS